MCRTSACPPIAAGGRLVTELWGKLYVRFPVTAILICGACFLAIWFGSQIASIIVVKAYFGATTTVHVPAAAPHLTPSLFLAVLPIVPFWLLAESGFWHRGKPLPLGSYFLFIIVFFFVFFVSALIDMSQNQKNAITGMLVLIAACIGAAFFASAASGSYFLVWRWRQKRLASIAPDMF